MKKNNKGFMLVEVIVTSTVIITAIIGLYSSFNRLYTKYSTKNNYYDIDSKYATKIMVDQLMQNNFNQFINAIFNTSENQWIIKNGRCTSSTGNLNIPEICSSIQSLYYVKNMIITEYDKENLLALKARLGNQTFKEYIDYIINYYDITNSNLSGAENTTSGNQYAYIVITETEEDGGNDVHYSNIRIR